VAIVFCGAYVLPPVWVISIGILVVLLSVVYSIRTLSTLIALEELPRPVRKLLAAIGAVPSA
jgi:hypothetical protein